MNLHRSWGRYPAHANRTLPNYWQDDVADNLRRILETQPDTLAHGNGRSYGDSCLSPGPEALGMRRLKRFIRFDREQGVLTAEVGVTLGEILQLVIPAGWFLAVTPGTQHVTLGGAIAND